MLATGWLSDRVGRKPLLLAALALGFVGALPLLWLMHHADPALILVGQLGFVLVLGTVLGTQPALMVEATPADVRCTAIAIGYNVTLRRAGRADARWRRPGWSTAPTTISARPS